MKRLLLICGVAALLLVPVATAKPAASAATVSAACGTNGSVCPLGQPITFTATGVDAKHQWEKCYTQVDQTSPCLPVPITDPVVNGAVTFTLDGSIFRTAGVYTVYLLEDQGNNRVFRTSVAVSVG